MNTSKDWIEEFINLLSTERMNYAYWHIKAPNIPKSLYKYRQVNEYSLLNLKDNILYLSEPQKFNDPYDSGLTFNAEKLGNGLLKADFEAFFDKFNLTGTFSNEEQQSIKNSDDPIGTIAEIFAIKNPSEAETIKQLQLFLKNYTRKSDQDHIKRYAEQVKPSLKICCFCEENNVQMWANYADDHKGFCIEYDFNALPANDLRNRFLYPVVYNNRLYDVTDHLMPIKDQINPGASHLAPLLACLHKSEKWEHEKEWRLVYPFGVLSDNIIHSPVAKAIYLGARIAHEDREKVASLAFTLGIPIFQMKIGAHSYVMETEKYSLGNLN